MYIYIYIYIYTHLHIYICIYIDTYIYRHIYRYIYTDTYIPIHIYIHIHIYIYGHPPQQVPALFLHSQRRLLFLDNFALFVLACPLSRLCVCVCLFACLPWGLALSLSLVCVRGGGVGAALACLPGAWARGQWKGLDPVGEAPAQGPWARPLGDASGPDPWARPPPGPRASQKKSPEKKKRADFQKNAKSMRLFAFSSLRV